VPRLRQRRAWLNHGLGHDVWSGRSMLPRPLSLSPKRRSHFALLRAKPYVHVQHINYIGGLPLTARGPLAVGRLFVVFKVRAASGVGGSRSVVAAGGLVGAEGVGGHDHGPPLGAQVGFLDDGRRVGPNHAADGHEEAGFQSAHGRGGVPNTAQHNTRRHNPTPHLAGLEHTRTWPPSPACTVLVSA